MGATRKKTDPLPRKGFRKQDQVLVGPERELKLCPDRAVYLDETGFERTTHHPHGWAPKGRKVFGECSGKSRPRTNLVAATVKGKRLFAPLLFEGSLDDDVFNHYLKEQLLKELQPGSLIIMDNAAFHKTRKTRELIEGSGHELSFLPPDFNPIEKHFANLKKIRAYLPPALPLTTLFDCTVINDFYYNPRDPWLTYLSRTQIAPEPPCREGASWNS
jgi:transposase